MIDCFPQKVDHKWFLPKGAIPSSVNPFGTPEPLPTLNASNFVPNNGFPVVKGLTSVIILIATRHKHITPAESNAREFQVVCLPQTWITNGLGPTVLTSVIVATRQTQWLLLLLQHCTKQRTRKPKQSVSPKSYYRCSNTGKSNAHQTQVGCLPKKRAPFTRDEPYREKKTKHTLVLSSLSPTKWAPFERGQSYRNKSIPWFHVP